VSERRYDPTHDEWVTFATHRQDRTYKPSTAPCPLCPTRPGHPPTEIPREHVDIAVFDNRFPSLTTHPPAPSVRGTDLVPVEPAYGHCEVVVFTDDHDATLASVGVARVRLLVEAWAQRVADLAADERIRYVMPFENKGEAVGVTLHHPHGQIYAYPDVPPRPARELTAGRRHHDRTGRCVFCDVVAQEAGGPRQVVAGTHFLAGVRPWARFPYEIDIWSRAHVGTLPELDGPPHRGGGKLKYLAGSETFAGDYLTDVAPEEAATGLRASCADAEVPA
jgi:UDPglucose--hexose-1-phosphate uridylyltransferase